MNAAEKNKQHVNNGGAFLNTTEKNKQPAKNPKK